MLQLLIVVGCSAAAFGGGWLLGLGDAKKRVQAAKAARQDEFDALQQRIALEKVRAHRMSDPGTRTMEWLSTLPPAEMRRPKRETASAES